MARGGRRPGVRRLPGRHDAGPAAAGPGSRVPPQAAGGRGAGTTGLKFSDGGDYRAVEKVENRDSSWGKQMDDALAEFQKDGKVGKGRNQ